MMVQIAFLSAAVAGRISILVVCHESLEIQAGSPELMGEPALRVSIRLA